MMKRVMPLLILALLTGCQGKPGSVPTSAIVSHANKDYFNFQEFNGIVSNISDTESAIRAFNYFADYAGSRAESGQNRYGLQTMSRSAAALEIFSREAMLRTGGLSVQSGDELITSAELTQVMSQACDNANSFPPPEELIVAVRDAVRTKIPTLPVNDRPEMTPLEATIVAYTIRTGDDGTVPPETLYPLVDEEVEAFVTTLGGL